MAELQICYIAAIPVSAWIDSETEELSSNIATEAQERVDEVRSMDRIHVLTKREKTHSKGNYEMLTTFENKLHDSY